uniref:Uncharacterized protein n=1 Tax=Salix viminalis TaxID=40686 RepID=A0A6N2LRH5_SALVM
MVYAFGIWFISGEGLEERWASNQRDLEQGEQKRRAKHCHQGIAMGEEARLQSERDGDEMGE